MIQYSRNKNKDAKIVIGYTCNNDCIFCMDKMNRNLPEKSTEDIKQEIREAKKQGFKSINFLGGEITVRPDCIDLLGFASNLKFESVNITTNGRMFYYFDFAKKIISTGVTNIIFSIHGHNPALHDLLTGANGSFQQLFRGILNLKKLGFRGIGTNTTIVKQNYKFLPDIAKILAKLEIKRAEFIYCYSDNNFKNFVPRVSDAFQYIRQAIEMGKENNFNWTLQNVPVPCLFHDYFPQLGAAGEGEVSNLVPNNKSLLYRSAEKRKNIIRKKLPLCSRCFHNNQCLGIWEDYLNQYGDKETKPVLKSDTVFNLFWDYARFLIKKNKLSRRENFIKRITHPLFNGMSPETLKNNQKFDFSLSSNSDSFRFSFNDFGERCTSSEKYLRFFSNFPKNCSLNLVRRILESMQPNEKHQTTVGAEIGREADKDRLKLYFEDFEYPNEEIAKRLIKILSVLRMPAGNVKSQIGSMKINAIGIDFIYGKKICLKIYTRHTDLGDFFQDESIKEFQKKMPLSPGEFYLLTFRFDKDSKLISKKIYKVYNIVKYRERIKENAQLIIDSLKKNKNERLSGKILDSIDFLYKNKTILVPVLFSEDRDLGKTDVYFTINKAQ